MRKYNLRPILTAMGVVVPFVIAAFLYNSTKARNDKIMEIETRVSNSDAIADLQATQKSMNDVIEILSERLAKSQLDYEEIILKFKESEFDRQSEKDTTKSLNALLDQLEKHSEQIKELQQTVNFSETDPREVEDIVIETMERLFRKIGEKC